MQTRVRFASDQQQDAVAPVVVSRQPILDLCERIVAFELLTPAVSAGEATASVLAQAIADIGLSRLAGEHPVHVDVTREFMVTVRPLPLNPERVVLEVPADSPPDALLELALREAQEQGFQITLDGFRAGDAEPLLRYAANVKLDIGRMDEEEIEAAVNVARGCGLTLIAGGVNTRRDYGVCRSSASTPSRASTSRSRWSSPASPPRPTACARCRCSPPARRRPSSNSSA